MTAVPIEVVCGRCGRRIATMAMLRPVKDVARKHGGKCPSCGQVLSASDFSVEASEV